MPNPPLAYWIAHVTVHDEKAYEKYKIRAAEAVAAHGGEFVARGGRYKQMEGKERAWNTVAIFPSFEAALACYRSPEYRTALQFVDNAADRDLVIVEGN
jgi:uncharacterized protein (DUF1330 family)